jgi:hypothetical protein
MTQRLRAVAVEFALALRAVEYQGNALGEAVEKASMRACDGTALAEMRSRLRKVANCVADLQRTFEALRNQADREDGVNLDLLSVSQRIILGTYLESDGSVVHPVKIRSVAELTGVSASTIAAHGNQMNGKQVVLVDGEIRLTQRGVDEALVLTARFRR